MMLLACWWLIGQIVWLKALERLGGKAYMKDRNHLSESTDQNLVCLVLITECQGQISRLTLSLSTDCRKDTCKLCEQVKSKVRSMRKIL